MLITRTKLFLLSFCSGSWLRTTKIGSGGALKIAAPGGFRRLQAASGGSGYATLLNPVSRKKLRIRVHNTALLMILYTVQCTVLMKTIISLLRYGAGCAYIHGETCDYCGNACLHPTPLDQRRSHLAVSAMLGVL